MAWYRRLVNVLRPGRLWRDIDTEIAFHIAELVDELMDQGLSEREARREALRRFGHREDLRERTRRMDLITWCDSVVGDMRHAMRALVARPGFTLVAVLSLGLGIGANTAIFSLINAVVLRSLPIRHPEELVQLLMGNDGASFTNPLWEQIRDHQDALAGVLAFAERPFDLTNGGIVRQAAGALVSGSYFGVLGVPPATGRLLMNTDDVRGCQGVAVVSHGFWQREYGGEVHAVGTSLSLDGHPFNIVGVVTPGFTGAHVGRSPDVYVPICSASILTTGADILDARSSWFLKVFGRLPPGGSVADVETGLARVARTAFQSTIPQHWTAEGQERYVERTLTTVPAATGLSVIRTQYQDALFALLVIVGVVLLISCANVAQLLLARATSRHQEIAVRLALGSGRGRLARQLLTEGLLLAMLGAIAGTVFARWSSAFVVSLLGRQRGAPVSLDLSLAVQVLLFTVAIATVTGLLFGMAPAWRSTRISPLTAMRGGRGVVGHSQHRVMQGIVVGQLALSLVLVTAAALLVGSFRRLASVDLGFQRDGVLVVDADWSRLELDKDRDVVFTRELLDRMRDVPGVQTASASLVLPLGGSTWNDYVVVDGFTPAPEPDALVWFNGVTDGFLSTMGTQLLAGRDFTPADRDGNVAVALVNETLANRFFGGANPLGRHLRVKSNDDLGPPLEIVGVMEDGKYERPDEVTLSTAYVPLAQTGGWGPSIHLALRTDRPTTAMVPAVTESMRAMNPGIALEFTTLYDLVDASLTRPRLLATLAGFFGVLALLLAVIGLYGTMAYSVATRRNEIGVRIALGAAGPTIVRMLVGEAGVVVVSGVAVGVLLAVAMTRLIAGFLFGVTASDPITLTASAITLATATVFAATLPAWRATRVEPTDALRRE
jgi:predicted permease